MPFKGGAGAKRRLEAVLSEEERCALAHAMLRDVLVALAGSPVLAGVLLVSRDADVHAFAAEVGARVFADSAADLSGAVVEASEFAAAKLGADGTLFVPGDVPLIKPADVAAVLACHDRVTLVPDANDIGTNAAASSPPNSFEYLFDGKSFKPHLAAAARAGVAARVVRRHAFGLDVDTAEELAAVARSAGGTRTGAFSCGARHCGAVVCARGRGSSLTAPRPAFAGAATGDVQTLTAFPKALAADAELARQFRLGELVLIGQHETQEEILQRA